MRYLGQFFHAIALAVVLVSVSPATFAAGGHGNADTADRHTSRTDVHGSVVGRSKSEGGHDYPFGEPARDAEADRTVEITARDTMRFDPASLRVKPGETVRFVVRNVGQVLHAFTLGTPEQQREHEAAMQGMSQSKLAGHMGDSANGIVIKPGETRTLTWRFEDGGPVEFACHIPGHYPAGMKGSIDMG